MENFLCGGVKGIEWNFWYQGYRKNNQVSSAAVVNYRALLLDCYTETIGFLGNMKYNGKRAICWSRKIT